MPETARRLGLRVTAKLFGLVALGACGFVLLSGLWPEPVPSPRTPPIPVAHLQPGTLHRIDWNGRRVLILHRAQEMAGQLSRLDATLLDPGSLHSEQPAQARNLFRSATADYFVALDYDPDFGCPLEMIPAAQAVPVSPWIGGFRSPCSDSYFDPAGRVYRNQRTTHNLRVPPHRLEAGGLVLGE